MSLEVMVVALKIRENVSQKIRKSKNKNKKNAITRTIKKKKINKGVRKGAVVG